MITFAELLARDRGALGTWVKIPAVESVELMALAGMDFVVVDLEHSPLTLETASTMIAVGRGRGLCMLVRVPDHSTAWIQRCLDAGAAGVLVPHVDSSVQAAAVGRAARFEPSGTRGVGPTSRAGGWGMTSAAGYLDSAWEVAVVAQIESDAGVRAASEMATDGHVQALFVGPADLSVSLGMAADDVEVTRRIQQVADDCRTAGVPCGTAVGADPELARARVDQGFSFVMVSNDATILGAGARDLRRAFRPDTTPGAG